MILAMMSSVSALPSTENIVALWDLEDLTDSVGSNTLTSAGSPSNVGCRFNNCYQLDGNDDTLTDADFFSTNNFTNLTISLWFKMDAKDTSSYDKPYAFGSTNDDRSSVYLDSGGVYWRLQQDIDGANLDVIGTTNFNVGEWYNLISIWDDTNNSYTFYLNNTQEVQITSMTTSLSSLINKNLDIGHGDGTYFEGSIDRVVVYNKALNSTERQELVDDGTQFAPVFLSYNITNTAPVRTNDVIDVNFKLDDDGQETNVSLTWFKSTDNATWTPHTSDNETFNNVTLNTTINSGTAGDLEAVDTVAFDYWKAQLSATNTIGTTSVNTTSIFINNDAPVITSSTSGTTNLAPADKGDTITFNVTGTDVEEDIVKLKVCSNSGANWSTCTPLAQDLTGVAWSSTVNTSTTVNYVTTEDTRNNTGYAIIFDGGNYSFVNITYYVNQYPVLDTITHQDLDGDSTYFFKETIDYFRVNMNDSYDNVTLTPYITVSDPEGVVEINNQSMTLLSGINFEYTTDLYLDAVGTWNISISVTDSDGAITILNDTFNVTATTLTSLGRVYAYDTGSYTNYTNISDLITAYGYYAIEVHITNDIIENNWTAFKSIIGEVKNNSQFVIITLDDNLSNATRTINNINTSYADLIGADYLNGILMFKLNVMSASNTSTNTGKINNISKELFQRTDNYLPHYVKDYVSSELNTNYILEDIYNYISTDNRTNYVDTEINLLRTTTDKSRFYNNITDSFKGYARDWQLNVIDKLRSGINISTTYTSNIAELNNLDIIVANNQTTTQIFEINTVAGTNGQDIYDLTQKNIVELDTDQAFNLTVQPYSADILYFTNLEKIVVNDDDEINLFGDAISGYPENDTYGGATSNAFLFASSSANPDDGRIFLTDPSFSEMEFYVWYGTNGYEAIANWSRYNKVIIGDSTNETWVEEIGAVTSVFGYTAVNTYGNNNMPIGCTAGVNCTSWNRSYWVEDLKTDIDFWSDMNSSVNIFIDGLDIGAVNDVDGEFGDALIELTGYVKNTKDKEVILNTYTSYQDYANLGDYTMRESACGRWNGSVSSPTYSYESITLEKQRANFHKTHNVPVLGQIFGAITDYEKAYYCYMQTKVLYGDLAEVSYNQPLFDYTGATDDFQWNFYNHPDLGVQLEDDYTEDSDTMTRRFENGIVTVNTTSHTVDFENNLNVLNMKLCAYYYDNDDGANDEGYMHYVINDNLSKAFNVVDTDLTAFVKTWKCQNISTSFYEPSGWYELEFYYIDSDANYVGNTGLYMYHDTNTTQDKLSQWESTLNDHPSNDETEYWQFNIGDNWGMSFMINGTRETPIDEITSVVDRNESGTEVLNITFIGTTDWDLPIYDKQLLLNKSQFNKITVNGTNLVVFYSSLCGTNEPLYNITTVDGYNWSACYYNASPSGYDVNVIMPKLSTQTYIVDGNTYPTVDAQSIVLNSLSNGNQNITISFNVSDADNNSIDACKVDVDGITTNGSYSTGVCTVIIETAMNTTSQIFIPEVFDEHDGQGNGTSYNSFTAVFDSLTWDNLSTASNQSLQYFWNNYNITYDWEVNFTDIGWSINSSYTDINVNLTNGTNSEQFEINYSLVALSNYTLVTDVADTYYVNEGETIHRRLNVSNALGIILPQFNMSYVPTQYTAGSQTLSKFNGSTWNSYNLTTGNPMVWEINTLTNGSTSQYNLSHQSKVIYTTDDTLIYSQDGSTRTYYWNGTNGLKYNFLFSELLGVSNSIYHNIDYADITSWSDRTSSTNVFKDNDNNTLIQNSDYTLTDTPASDLLILNFAPLSGDTYYRFNLTYDVEVTVYQCNDGLDNDGDGDIDYPADAGCSSATDNTEDSDTPAGGGGGGGGSTTVDIGDSGKIDCSISVSPKSLSFRDTNLIEELTITNNEEFNIDPEISFVYISGSTTLTNQLRITNDVDFIDTGETGNIGIRLNDLILVEGTSTANLIIETTKCKNIIVPVDIKIEQGNTIGEIFDSIDEKTLKEIIVESFNESVFGGDETTPDIGTKSFVEKVISKLNTVGGITMILAIIFLIMLLPIGETKPFSQNKFFDFFARAIIWFILVGFSWIVVKVITYLL
jgi:hypothetical protein